MDHTYFTLVSRLFHTCFTLGENIHNPQSLDKRDIIYIYNYDFQSKKLFKYILRVYLSSMSKVLTPSMGQRVLHHPRYRHDMGFWYV